MQIKLTDNSVNLRGVFLAVISLGVAAVTVYSIVEPSAGSRSVKNFSFPEHIPLNNWKQLSTDALFFETQPDENGEFIKSAQRYRYEKQGVDLTVEIAYLAGTRGNIPIVLKEHFKVSSVVFNSQQIRQIEGIGSYLLISDRNGTNTAYLSSCITPFNNSIVEQKEFSRSLNQVPLTPQLLWNWWWGKASIRDRRCLLVHLSLPLENGDLDATYDDLEEVWFDLYQWWKPRFPEL